MGTVEDREEETEGVFVEAELVHLVEVVEVSRFGWFLWALVPLDYVIIMSL